MSVAAEAAVSVEHLCQVEGNEAVLSTDLLSHIRDNAMGIATLRGCIPSPLPFFFNPSRWYFSTLSSAKRSMGGISALTDRVTPDAVNTGYLKFDCMTGLSTIGTVRHIAVQDFSPYWSCVKNYGAHH